MMKGTTERTRKEGARKWREEDMKEMENRAEKGGKEGRDERIRLVEKKEGWDEGKEEGKMTLGRKMERNNGGQIFLLSTYS